MWEGLFDCLNTFDYKKVFFSPHQSMFKAFSNKPFYFERVEEGDDDDDDGAVLSIKTQRPPSLSPAPPPPDQQVLKTETTKLFPSLCRSVVLDSYFTFVSCLLFTHTHFIFSSLESDTHTHQHINSLLLTASSQS